MGFQGELHTPFPSAQNKTEGIVLDRPSANYPHLAFILEKNRAAQSIDLIVSNKGANCTKLVLLLARSSGGASAARNPAVTESPPSFFDKFSTLFESVAHRAALLRFALSFGIDIGS
jgi:hypothetical protein